MPKKLPDMYDHCRMCLVDHGCMTSLQDDRVTAALKDLVKCTSIDIKQEENLPGVVCHVCLYKLDMWSKFKEQFIQSNKILMGQLKASEISDNVIKDFCEDEALPTESTKRKHLNESGEDIAANNNKKKSKVEVSSSNVTNVDCTVDQSLKSKTISISDNGEAVTSKDSSHKVLHDSDSNKHKKDEENGNEEGNTEGNLSSGLTRTRLLPGRRGRAIERRKASTKRWEERKKALLAATRKEVSDSDSITSDDTQLSPVQKARAKTNVDKELERQKRVARVLKNLESNLVEKYTTIHDGNDIDMDSDIRRTRLNKDVHSNTTKESKKELSQKQKIEKQSGIKRNRSSSQENSMGKENSSLMIETNKITTESAMKTESQSNDEILTPRSMKAELVIGDSKYVVTSLLAGSQFDKDSLNNLTKYCNFDESGQEKNTDIIDAVQLRRINPIASNSNTKQSVERCLNIEVEGTGLETLRRVQIELVDFVENEMKNKLFGTNCDSVKVNKSNVCTKHSQKLDQQLKNIIERTIINNIEFTLTKDAADMSSKASNQYSTRVSPAFVQAAVNSPKYQPKVMLKRLDLIKLNKLYNIDIKTLKQLVPKSRLTGPFSAISRKRQSVLPKKYNDYNTSALDSDSNESDVVQETPRAMTAPNVRTYRNLKHSAGTNVAIIKRMDGSIVGKPAVDNVTLSVLSVGQNSVATTTMNEEKPDYEDVIKIEGAIAENHICGVCGLTFSSRKDVEMHVRTHKVTNTENNATVPRQNQKQKMMRCRRCQEIVEARYVKAHTCKNVVHTHKCYVCNSTFRTEKLLVRHLDNHDQSEFNIEKITKVDSKRQNNNDISKTTAASILIVSTKPEKEQKIDASNSAQTILTERNNVQSDKITTTSEKLNGANAVEKPKETYTCFVCDKIFTDEEVLKDHLQKHCDDLSEGEQNNSKEQYQCAICGDTLESDQALEEHVKKHLFDDEDDNPNLISIGDQENEKLKNETYHCGQCSKVFDSDILLEMHMQAHEEEAAIAEWERKGINVSPYQCMLCEQSEFLDTEEELAVHLDVIHNIRNGDAEVCQLCDKSFRTLEDLQEHVATH